MPSKSAPALKQTVERPRARRADAERSVAAILDAATDALAADPDATMADIARRAGVVRATIYVHFPTREALITAATDRAIAESTDALRAAKLEEGDPRDALTRALTVSWRTLARYHPLVQINTRLAPEQLHALHQPVLRLIRPLLKRGQATGAFNRDLPVDWMLTVVLELIHAASRSVSTGALTDSKAERVLIATTLGALSAPA
ncbi:MAG: TetR/AcrR family transcriptional regulator [Solirubrobacteraceae bacterium]